MRKIFENMGLNEKALHIVELILALNWGTLQLKRMAFCFIEKEADIQLMGPYSVL